MSQPGEKQPDGDEQTSAKKAEAATAAGQAQEPTAMEPQRRPAEQMTPEKAQQERGRLISLLRKTNIRFPMTGTTIPSSWKVLERYPVNNPFAYAEISESPLGVKRYFLDEVPLTRAEAGIYSYLLDTLEAELTVPRSEVNPRTYFAEQARRIILKYSIRVPATSWSKIIYFAERDLVGFGVLDGPLKDAQIEDISIDGSAKPIFVYHKAYETLETNVTIPDDVALDGLITRLSHMAGKHVSTAFPIVQGTLPGRHRLIATFRKEVSPMGSSATIRKFREDPLTIIDMINLNLLDHTLAAYTWLLMQNRSTAIVVGATGAGKTTLLNAILTLTRLNTKLVTIEEVQEINVPHQNWTPLVARESYAATEEKAGEVSLFDLVKAAMRMRPDILVVGEVRGEEAYVLFQAISTGHGGLCLPPWERLPVIINGSNSLLTMQELVDSQWDQSTVSSNGQCEISVPKGEVLVPSFDVASNRMGHARVRRLSRRKYNGKLLTIKTTGGNAATVTEDHPMLVLREGKVVRVPAKELLPDDLLTCVDELPMSKTSIIQREIDLVDEVIRKGLQTHVVVRNVRDLLYSGKRAELAEVLGVRARSVDDYRKKDYLPFEKYTMLRDANRQRRFLRFRKSPHQVPAVLPLDRSFSRLLGFYLAEGHATKHRIDFSFNLKEMGFAREVQDALASCFGMRSRVKQSGPNAIQVIIKDRLVSLIFSTILGAGTDSYTKRVPGIALKMEPDLVKELLDTYFQGDGSAFMGKDGRPSFQTTTASKDLAYGVFYLMLSIGYHLNVGLDKRYGNSVLTVSGGENFRRFVEEFNAGRRLRGAVLKGNPGAAEKVPMEYVVNRTPNQLMYTRMAEGNRFVSKQVLDRMGLARPNGVYFAPIQTIEEEWYSGYVYDLFEVENSHTFVHGFGIISSNCTLHADDEASAVQRLISAPMNVPLAFLPFLDLVFVVRRISTPTASGSFKAVRRIISVDEIINERESVQTFRWDATTDTFKAISLEKSPRIMKLASESGFEPSRLVDEIERRAVVLKWIQQKGIRNFKEVSPQLDYYISRPEEVYQRALSEIREIRGGSPVAGEIRR